MPSYQFGNISFEYAVERSDKRKTVAIIIDPHSGVVVRTPSTITGKELEDILKRKSPWIQRKLKDIDDLPPSPPPKEYVSGESFQYLGRNYRLKVIPVEDGEESAKLFQGRFIVYTRQTNSGGRVKHFLERWYQSHAMERIAERVDFYASRLDVLPSAIKVKHQEKRWGSCTPRGTLNFNWRIILAPMSIVDYVVVHELCHHMLGNIGLILLVRIWKICTRIRVLALSYSL